MINILRTRHDFRDVVLSCPFTDINRRVNKLMAKFMPPLIPALDSSFGQRQRFPLRPAFGTPRDSSVPSSSTESSGINLYDMPDVLLEITDIITSSAVPESIESDPMQDSRMDGESSVLLPFAL